MKLNLFYSYCQKNDKERSELQKHLDTLKENGLVDEWYDGKIMAGQKWQAQIDSNLKEANIVVFLITPEWLASTACKKEWEDAKKWSSFQTNKVLIPVIAIPCAWTDYSDMSKYQALPKAGKPVMSWASEAEAWLDVYKGIKIVIEDLKKKSGLIPQFEAGIREIEFCSKGDGKVDIQDIFVFPNLKSYSTQLDQSSLETDVKELSDLFSTTHQFIIGDSQSGKTTLAAWCYLDLVKRNLPALYVDMETVGGFKDKKVIIKRYFEEQQIGDFDEWFEKGGKTIFLDNPGGDKITTDFIDYVKDNFENIYIFINSDLYQSCFSDDEGFAKYREVNIRPLCHVKQEKLIKKWLELKGDGSEEQYELIDSIERNINSIVINNNILPRFPFFILSILQTFENFMPENLKITAYGHCYQALIVARLIKSGINKEDSTLDTVFTFCTHFAYEIHTKGNNKYLTQEQYDVFISKYDHEYIIKRSILNRLILDGGIVRNINGKYQFTISYTYYYFLGKFLAENYDTHRKIVEKMIASSFSKHHSLTIIFTIHHANGNQIIDELKLHTMCTIDAIAPAKLTPEETGIFSQIINNVVTNRIEKHANIDAERTKEREKRDFLEQKKMHSREIDDSNDVDANSLVHQVLACNKNIEILSQILKNKSGSLKKGDIREIVETVCEAGLRMASILMSDGKEIEQAARYVHELYIHSAEYNSGSNDSPKIHDIINLIIVRVMLWVINCLEKSVNAINKPDIVQIVNDVADEYDTPAYQLIRYFYLLDTAKTFNKDLKDEFERLLKIYPNKQYNFVRRLIQLRTLRFERTHVVKEQYRQVIFSALELKDRPLTIEQFENAKSKN